MPPRRAPARDDDDVDIHQMAYAMNTMAAAVTARPVLLPLILIYKCSIFLFVKKKYSIFLFKKEKKN
jgi:predicted RNA-binding protein associated with RNAse of E/G family